MEENNLQSTILILDDDKITTKMISYYLKDYNVITTNNYKEFVNELESNNIDLVLLDINMPEINGLEIVKSYKANEENRDIPFIFITSSDDSEIMQTAFEVGAGDYIKKPINKSELSLRVKSLLLNHSLINKLHIQSQELKEYQRVLNQSDIVSKSDLKGNIIFTNDMFCEISGYKREELLGKSHSILKHPDNPKSLYKKLWKTIKSKNTFKGIIKNKKKNGEAYYVDATISPILDVNDNIIEYIAIRHDITSIMNPKKQLLDQVKNLDNPILVLVQISNYDLIREFYTESIRYEFQLSFEKKLPSYFPTHANIDKIYNLGDGLFGFAKPKDKIDDNSIAIIIKETLKNIDEEGFEFQGNNYDIDLIFSFAYEGNHLYEDALIGIHNGLNENSDIVYAKNFYNKKQENAKQSLKTLTSLKNALKQNDKVVSYYQPIVDNSTKKIVKYESLIRMINDKDEVLPPFQFLSLAKKTGYYHQITLKVISNANYILNVLPISININLSLSDLSNLKVRTELLNLVSNEKNYGRVTFELLEDENVKDFSIVKDFIGLSKLLGGVTIAIDDFGSGYSNYERLLEFQPDFIKIDGSLIKNIKEPFNKSIIKSIILFSKENNLKTVAEFVGDEETYNLVKDLDIDYSQGFYFGKPEPIVLNY